MLSQFTSIQDKPPIPLNYFSPEKCFFECEAQAAQRAAGAGACLFPQQLSPGLIAESRQQLRRTGITSIWPVMIKPGEADSVTSGDRPVKIRENL